MLKKTAIITGSAGNLGQAVVKKMTATDYHVIGTIHGKQEKNRHDEKDFEEIELDLLNEEGCRKFVEEAVAKNKTIEVAVLTAGGFAMGNIMSTKTSDIFKQYQLNFETTYNIAKPIFRQMIKQNRGRIFFIGSRAGADTSKAKGVTAYSLSKSLLFRLAELMNDEAKNKNVTVSVVVPSIIDTPQNRKSMPDADFSAWVTPSQIADVIYLYSADEASIIREPVIKVYNRS
jgi:NAD(P)-dependent dehydrogenase (short-subunit alcohol dehydrogenase family)